MERVPWITFSSKKLTKQKKTKKNLKVLRMRRKRMKTKMKVKTCFPKMIQETLKTRRKIHSKLWKNQLKRLLSLNSNLWMN